MKKYIEKANSIRKNNAHTIHGFFQLSFIRVFQLALGLGATYFIAHSLTVEKYGEYQFVLTVLGVLSVFTLTEFNNTLMQSVARGFFGSFRTMLPLPFKTSFIASLVLLGFGLWQGFIEHHVELMLCFFAAALLFPFTYGLVAWRGFLIGEQKFKLFSRIEISTMLITQCGMILLALLFEGQYIELFLWFSVVPALVNIIMIRRLLARTDKAAPAEDGVIPHGLSSSFYVSFSVVANYADKLLLFFFLSPVALALYVAAERVPDLLRSVVQDAATALAPKFASTESYTKKLDYFFKGFCLLIAVALVILSFTVLPYLITTIYGDQYAPAIPYTQALILGVALNNLASLQFRYIRSKLDTENFRNIMVVTSLFRMAISLALIPMFGLEGAVASTLIYKLFLAVFTDRVVRKNYMLGKST